MLRRRCRCPARLTAPTGGTGTSAVARRANPAGVIPQRSLGPRFPLRTHLPPRGMCDPSSPVTQSRPCISGSRGVAIAPVRTASRMRNSSVSARPGVCGVTGTYGARVPSVHGRGLITVIFRLPSIDRRASEPGRRSNRTEGTPAEPSEWQALPTSPGRPAPSHVTAGQPPLLCTTTASMCPCRRTGWPRFLGPRPRLLTSSGRIDIRDDAANHPHHSTHRGLLVIDGPCPPANDDRSPSR